MPVAYDPAHFWGVVFTRAGSVAPLVFVRSVGMLVWAGFVVGLHHAFPYALAGFDDTVLFPFQMMVAFVIGFRLNMAFTKYEKANEAVLEMHADSRKILNRLMAYLLPGEETDEALLKIRRLLVLACVLIKKHVRVEKSFDVELAVGLITERELVALTKVVTTEASMPGGDGKKDKYPSRNRPSFAFYRIQDEVTKLFRAGHLPSPPQTNGLDFIIDHLSDTLEKVELLGLTIVPLPYAQVTRWICLSFLVFLPFDTIERPRLRTVPGTLVPAKPNRSAPRQSKSWSSSSMFQEDHWLTVRVQADVLTIVLSFFSNLIYFAIDEVATQLEAPFGRDENDVDFEKMLRRIDKHTASQLSLRLGRLVPNFDLYPEARKTDTQHTTMSNRGRSVYELNPDTGPTWTRPIRRASNRFWEWANEKVTTGRLVQGNDNTFFVEKETNRLERENRAKAEREMEKSSGRRSAWRAALESVNESNRSGSPLGEQPASLKSVLLAAKLQQAVKMQRPSSREDDGKGLGLAHQTSVAVVRIQALSRGHLSRKQLSMGSRSLESVNATFDKPGAGSAEAAAQIQARYRGRMVRRQASRSSVAAVQLAAAMRIQREARRVPPAVRVSVADLSLESEH